jgi:protein TonB
MPSRNAARLFAGRRLPLALSLAFHGLALAALCRFAPLGTPRASEAEPLTVHFVAHASSTSEELEAAPHLDRKALPPEPSLQSAPTPSPNAEELFAELPPETFACATEVPASARRSVIGAGLYAAARFPHAPTVVAAAADAPRTLDAASPAQECALPPEPLDCPPPEYPAGAASVSECGRVRLEIAIGEDGRVESARILCSSGFARLDEAAQRGVEHWRFRPARRGGVPLRWTLEHTIVFRVASARG